MENQSGSFNRLADQRVAIVGLGLMGGSLALALRGKCAVLLGIDSDPQTCALALDGGVVDQATVDPGDLMPQASLVILAAPVQAILQLIVELPNLHPGQAVVLDLGSTKVEIAEALRALPERLSPVGGHPMCGKENNSLRHADPVIYQAAPFVLTRLSNSSEQALALVEELVRAVGARPLWLEAEEHDRWVAATSHLPYLLANALALSAPTEAAPVIGPGFRSTARLAGSSRRMMLDILMTNQANVLTTMERLRWVLDQIESALARGDFVVLEEWLEQGAKQYAAILDADLQDKHG